jgi:hypothetical protein
MNTKAHISQKIERVAQEKGCVVPSHDYPKTTPIQITTRLKTTQLSKNNKQIVHAQPHVVPDHNFANADVCSGRLATLSDCKFALVPIPAHVHVSADQQTIIITADHRCQ